MSYQKCCLCKGKGTIKKETCPACSGEKILCKKTGLPPSKYVYPYMGYPVYPQWPSMPEYPYYHTHITSDGITTGSSITNINTDNTVTTLNVPYTLTDVISQIN